MDLKNKILSLFKRKPEEEKVTKNPINMSYLLDLIDKHIDTNSVGLVAVSTANNTEVFRDTWGQIRTDLTYYGDTETVLRVHLPKSIVFFSFQAKGTKVSGFIDGHYANSNSSMIYGTYFETFMHDSHIVRFKQVLYKLEEYLYGGLNMAIWDALEEFEQLWIKKNTEW